MMRLWDVVERNDASFSPSPRSTDGGDDDNDDGDGCLIDEARCLVPPVEVAEDLVSFCKKIDEDRLIYSAFWLFSSEAEF